MNKVSIIIPVVNRADLTRVCIDSVKKYTKYPYELILVQEGEDKSVTKLLKSYKKAKYVHNRTPKGFAGAMNSGLEVATGNYYCFLNNDTVATPNWLTEIMNVFEENKDVGLVTPTFTEATTKQCVDYNQGEEVTFVDEPLSLKGVCFVVPKAVVDKIGKWDERFGLGGGDDNDFATRIKEGSFRLAIARRSYIYHYGSATFREIFHNDIDYSKKYAVGQFLKFKEKHKDSPALDSRPAVFLAIPSQRNRLHGELAMNLIAWSHDPEIRLKVKVFPYLSPLDSARNVAVKEFLEEYYDYLWFIDEDITPPVNALRELIKADKEIIAPLCFTIQYDDEGLPFPIPVAHRYAEDGHYRPYYGRGIEQVDFITGGSHLVKREVYEKLERPYSFKYHKNGIVIYSEDAIFSQNCQSLGYKLWTHYDLFCGHDKTIDCKKFNQLMVKYGKR